MIQKIKTWYRSISREQKEGIVIVAVADLVFMAIVMVLFVKL